MNFNFFTVLKVIFYVLLALIAVIFLMSLIFFVVSLFKKKKIPKRSVKSIYKKRNILLKIFWDLPKSLVNDFFDRDPDAMNIKGLFMICGEQGSGKTLTAVHLLRTMLQKYPKIRILSNTPITFQHGSITDWTQIINSNNGTIGEIDFLDEIQNWFSSNESKNFPIEMLAEITQQRKQHKAIIGTSQVFTRISKPLREQTRYLLLPVTLFGCFTIVRVYKPVVNDEGKMEKKKFCKVYCFVHDSELRDCYDTYAKIERLSSKGFQSATERGAINAKN